MDIKKIWYMHWIYQVLKRSLHKFFSYLENVFTVYTQVSMLITVKWQMPKMYPGHSL